MAKAGRERKPTEEPDGQPGWPGVHGAAPSPTKTARILLMQLQVGDRLTDESAEWEDIWPAVHDEHGKNAHVRVRRVDQADLTEIRTWSAHERISVKRAGEGK